MNRVEQVIELWGKFDEGRFEELTELLPARFVAHWPQTREVIRGADNFIQLNKNYPGVWRCQVLKIVEAGDQVISVVKISDDETAVYATSFFEFRANELLGVTEFFADEDDPPFDRTRWAERYDPQSLSPFGLFATADKAGGRR